MAANAFFVQEDGGEQVRQDILVTKPAVDEDHMYIPVSYYESGGFGLEENEFQHKVVIGSFKAFGLLLE